MSVLLPYAEVATGTGRTVLANAATLLRRVLARWGALVRMAKRPLRHDRASHRFFHTPLLLGLRRASLKCIVRHLPARVLLRGALVGMPKRFLRHHSVSHRPQTWRRHLFFRAPLLCALCRANFKCIERHVPARLRLLAVETAVRAEYRRNGRWRCCYRGRGRERHEVA